MSWQHLFSQSKLKTLLKFCGGTLLTGVLLIVLLLLLFLGTQSGRIFLAQSAVKAVNASGALHIQLDKLNSPSLGAWFASKIVVTENQTELVKAENIRLTWQLKPLLQSRLVVTAFSLDSLHINPALWQNPQSSPKPESEPFVLANLLAKKLPQIHLQQLRVKRLQFQPLQLGQAASPLPPHAA